jgi:DNA-binding CsgD family transcriptional regulator
MNQSTCPWMAMASGWDQCDSDGKRYVLARRNAPDVRDPKALTGRERTVLAFAAMGHQDKCIGYLLGLAPSTISGHLRSAQRKLGLASRADLIRRFAPLVQAPEEQGCLN